jgi:hypothetical protein
MFKLTDVTVVQTASIITAMLMAAVRPSDTSVRAMMMEAVRTSETSVNLNMTTRRYIPEDSKLQYAFALHYHSLFPYYSRFISQSNFYCPVCITNWIYTFCTFQSFKRTAVTSRN